MANANPSNEKAHGEEEGGAVVAVVGAVIAYYYLPDQNPEGGNTSYPGAPERDLLQHEYDAVAGPPARMGASEYSCLHTAYRTQRLGTNRGAPSPPPKPRPHSLQVRRVRNNAS